MESGELMASDTMATASKLGNGDWAGQFADPVFVMCNGRSGSTLLRFLLDAHPDLACPPETNLPGLCGQLATVWSLIEGAPLNLQRGDEPPHVPDSAIAGVRHTMDRMVGSYLARRGKKRYCDKSLGTARFADLLTRVYPEARFLCLYRHPMDVIASGLEACPWGLNGYGFDPYIADTPGNSIMALARFWADSATTSLAAEEKFPELCYRVYYEDIATDPENVASGIFEFLDAAPAAGVSASCFSSERERFGPGDHKIWFTSKISDSSVGRGWSIPSAMIAPPVLAVINELCGKLGYLPIDESWGTTQPPTDLRIRPGAAAAEAKRPIAAGNRKWDLGRTLAEKVRRLDDTFPERWSTHAAESWVAVILPDGNQSATEYWRIDLGARDVAQASQDAQETSDWDIVGSASDWEQVLSGRLNLSVALRSCRLRCCEDDEGGPVATDNRLAMLADVLGLAAW
jgi:hypothetical protein